MAELPPEGQRLLSRKLAEVAPELIRVTAARLAAERPFQLLGYQPTDRQAEFHNAREFDVLYGGAAGGGKTKALLMDGIRACARYPGIRVGAFRKTWPELRDSLLAELAEIGFARAVGAQWLATDRELRFPNDSRLMFRYAETLPDASKQLSAQYQLLLFDERTLMAPDVVAFLSMRLRSGRPEIPVLGVRSGSNPGGPGHGAVKAHYIDATSRGQHVVTDERGRTVRFIQAKLSDNPHVNSEYAADLRALPAAMRKAYLDGDWDVFAGQVFTEWSYDRHVVAPFTVPPSWERWAGIDWGYAAPWAVAWFAIDEDGRLWVYRELYGTKVGEREQAQRIRDAEGATGREQYPVEVVTKVGDSAMWETRGDAPSVAAIYAEEGVHMRAVTKGPGSRIARKVQLHDYLGDGPACAHHRAQGWDECPALHVFSTCEQLIRTLPTLPYDVRGTNVEDVDTRAEDHLYDALTYAITEAVGVAPAPVSSVGRQLPAELRIPDWDPLSVNF